MTHATTDVERQIEELVKTSAYMQLMQTRVEFDLFDFLGTLNENASSRALAFLLDSDGDHGLGARFYNEFLQAIHRDRKASESLLSLRDVLTFGGQNTRAATELRTEDGRRLDVIIRNYAPDRRLKSVVGIENKHWAAEQSQQISDYQRELARRFSGVPSLILFLAPGNRLPTTDDPNSPCRCIPCSYRTVITALGEVEKVAEPDVRLLISSLRRHFDKTLDGGSSMNQEIRTLVREMYRHESHRNAIRHIVDNVPRFGFLAERIVQRVQDHVQDKFPEQEFVGSFYPQRNLDRLCEIKLTPVALRDLTKDRGFRFQYVLHQKSEQNVADVPDIGDHIGVQLMAWLDTPNTVDALDDLLGSLKLPKPLGVLYSWYSHWKPIWSAGTYRISDLGDKDIHSCVELFTTAIDQTYEMVRATTERKT